jgi:excisionase family DNA binding protein
MSGRVAHLSPAGEVYITRQECAERLGIGVSTLDRWVKEKGLPSHRWGMRTRRFKFSEVERRLRELERSAA